MWAGVSPSPGADVGRGEPQSWRRRGQGRARRALAHPSARWPAGLRALPTEYLREYSEYAPREHSRAPAADTMRNPPKRHTHTHTHTHPRTRTGKWEWASAKRRKWERVPQQYAEGPPALAGGGPGCSQLARACLAANGCMRPPGLTRSTAKPKSEPAVRCHRAAYESRDRRGVAVASPHSCQDRALALNRGGGDASDDRRRWPLDCGECNAQPAAPTGCAAARQSAVHRRSSDAAQPAVDHGTERGWRARGH
jgi:hypothetical protein